MFSVVWVRRGSIGSGAKLLSPHSFISVRLTRKQPMTNRNKKKTRWEAIVVRVQQRNDDAATFPHCQCHAKSPVGVIVGQIGRDGRKDMEAAKERKNRGERQTEGRRTGAGGSHWVPSPQLTVHARTMHGVV